jgi:hypothetical protein
MQKPLKITLVGLITLSCLILISSCSVTNKAKRKLRKADKLIKEATILAPELVKTEVITKVDTLVLTKDSLVTKIRLTLDTAKVDSLIVELQELKEKGLDTKVIREQIFKEIIPDLTYATKDSIRIEVEGEEHWLRFDIAIQIRDDTLTVVTQALDNVNYTVEKTVNNIDATRKSFWQDWKLWLLIAVGVGLWFLRGIIGTAIKKF